MNTPFQTKFFIAFLLLLSGSYNIAAQDKIWTGAVDSSWHTAGNWSPAGVPAPSQTVGLRNNITPYPVVTTNVTVRSVTINAWYSNPGDQLRIRNNSTLTITDDLNIYGAGKLNIINGHVLMSATSSGANNFSANGAAAELNIKNGSFTAGTISEDVDIQVVGTINVGNGDFTIHGDLDVASGHTFNVQNGEVEVYGDTDVDGVYNGNDGTSNFLGTVGINQGGVMNLDNGTLNFNAVVSIGNNGTVNFGSGEVNIVADVNVSSGGYFNVQNANVIVSGNAQFTSNGNMSVDSGSITIGGNASLSSGGVISLNSGSLNIGGDASFTAGGSVNAGSSTITLEGDFTVNNNSNFNPDSSTVVFSGDSTQTVSSGSDLIFYNVQVDSGAVFNTDGGNQNTITVEGNLIVDEDGGVIIDDDDQLDVQGEIGGGGAGNVQSPSPFALSTSTPDLNTITIRFNKAMVEGPAETVSNYSIARVNNPAITLTVNSATLNIGSDSSVVTLAVSTISEDIQYEITINPAGTMESADGGKLSTNHKKRFTKFGPITFYSITSGNWSANSTWSRVSHSGPAATTNPASTSNATIIVGDGDLVTISSTTSIVNQTAVQVSGGSILRVGASGNLTLGTKTITGAGTFQVTTGTIQIGSQDGISASGAVGNIQTTSRSFGTGGTYVYGGSSAQAVGSGLPSTVENLRINNTSGVTLNSNLEVAGTLTLSNGSFIIESGNNLIANTKSIGSGNLVMRQTITGTKGWRLLSSPIGSDFDDFFDGIVTQGYSGAYYSTGSNPGDTLQPNILYYLESYPGTDNQRWRAPSNAAASINPGQGLFTYIFGDIDTDPLYNDIFPLPATLEVQGQEHEGPVDFGVTYTTTADSGWNFVGNPYAATINWDNSGAWTKTNIDETIYIWDYNSNQYLTWNGTAGDLGNGLISPFQGFWVKANDTAPVLTVEESAKTIGGTFVGKTISKKITSHPTFSISLGDDEHEVSTHFMFSQTAKIGKDQLDAYRLLPIPGISDYLELSSLTDNGDKYSINNLPRSFGRTIEIPIVVEAFEQGISTSKALNLSFKNFKYIPDEWTISLVDKETGNETTVHEGSIHPFNYKGDKNKTAPNKDAEKRAKITSKTTNSTARFVLKIAPGTDASELPQTFNLKQNYPNPFNPTTNIQFDLPIQSFARLTIFDMLGREVRTIIDDELPAGTHTFTWNASGSSSGVYLYRLVTSDYVITKKMTLIK